MAYLAHSALPLPLPPFLLLVLLLFTHATATALQHRPLPGNFEPMYSPSASVPRRLRQYSAQASTVCSGIRCPAGSCQAASLGSGKFQVQVAVPTCNCTGKRKWLHGLPSGAYACNKKKFAYSEWLLQHNAARSAVASPALQWNDALASFAQSWANTLAGDCTLAISSSRSGYGQNVGSSFPGFDVVVQQWVSTGSKYSLAPFNAGSASGCTTGLWQDCVTYIQAVWQYTKQIGCASASCANGTIMSVCNYYPAGVVNGYYPYTPCYKTTCSGATPVCDPNVNLPPQCVASPCSAVTCPSSAKCRLTSDAVPFCQCPRGSAMPNKTCVAISNPQSEAPQTSVVVYSATNFQGSVSIFRLQVSPDSNKSLYCMNLDFTIQSIKVVWNVNDGALSGGNATVCGAMAYWRGSGCKGGGQLDGAVSAFNTLAQPAAAPEISQAKSISCLVLPKGSGG